MMPDASPVRSAAAPMATAGAAAGMYDDDDGVRAPLPTRHEKLFDDPAAQLARTRAAADPFRNFAAEEALSSTLHSTVALRAMRGDTLLNRCGVGACVRILSLDREPMVQESGARHGWALPARHVHAPC